MRLVKYSNDYQTIVEQYCLSNEKWRYVSEPKEAIALTENDVNRQAVLALEKNKLVGFLVLHKVDRRSPYSDKENIMLIRNFSTDYRHLGKGYALKIIALLPYFVNTHFPQIEELLLGVNENKFSDYALYKKLGFRDTGVKKHTVEGIFAILLLHLDK